MLDYKFTSDIENKLDYKIHLKKFYVELSKWLKK